MSSFILEHESVFITANIIINVSKTSQRSGLNSGVSISMWHVLRTGDFCWLNFPRRPTKMTASAFRERQPESSRPLLKYLCQGQRLLFATAKWSRFYRRLEKSHNNPSHTVRSMDQAEKAPPTSQDPMEPGLDESCTWPRWTHHSNLWKEQ